MKMEFNSVDIFTSHDLVKFVSENKSFTTVIIRGKEISTLGEIEEFNGSVCICDSTLESLGNLKEVKGTFSISTSDVESKITRFDTLTKVGKDLVLRFSKIEDLGALEYVGGNLTLRDTNLRSLGMLKYVGGNLFLPKKTEGKIDLSKVVVKGKIRFWNDVKTLETHLKDDEVTYMEYDENIPNWSNDYIYSYEEVKFLEPDTLNFYKKYKSFFLDGKYIDLKGQNNYAFLLFHDLRENNNLDVLTLERHFYSLSKYYPFTKSYCQDVIVTRYEDIGDYEKSWQLYLMSDQIDLEKMIRYQSKISRELFDEHLIVRFTGLSCLTDFGRKNIDQIKPCIAECFQIYKNQKKYFLLDIFAPNGVPVRSKKIKNAKNISSVQNNLSLEIRDSDYGYDPQYYRKYFLSDLLYKHYKSIDNSQRKLGVKNILPHVVRQAILSQLKLIVRKAEDLYRERIGIPKVGEGWVSETELYYQIVQYFKDEIVLHHASPNWLGRQHLDIYMPRLNIAIEYQGLQHYEPVDYFGGIEAFQKTVERDNRKKELCHKHDCHLIYVQRDYSFDQLIKHIEKVKLEKLSII